MGESNKVLRIRSVKIKDLRTNHETGNTSAVLNGDLDDFMGNHHLKQEYKWIMKI